ncbi:teichoic-acid-transporting ATPase (plasmid) [Maritalea myrionectae]|uniref:Teichoic-acid-transporting ATPase n=1 Tax=Maritalea myrionectae TaxID=454601 RepID=A0A2R4MJC2_9HYPH|nr:oligopeptide/dipeptide ABC transporter ATP-binding protein [Maritalea myrionectae]AVX06064.1 teichoic-acid-transporting ATPase [Maritalea myrionectae]
MTETPLIEFKNISREFTRYDGIFSRLAHKLRLGKPLERLVALNNINLAVYAGETVGVVGESGCGKTTLGRIAAQLLSPTGGDILFDGSPLASLPDAEAKRVRTSIQMVFQNPYASLNPRRRIGDTIVEAALAHKIIEPKEKRSFLKAMMNQVGLAPELAHRFPHELSGGQRQRVGIARALAVDPAIVVFDEAVAALDVSIQAQILMLLQKLRRQEEFTALFISHDLNVVRHISDRVAVLYLGKIVEIAPTKTMFKSAHHPYSQALLAEAPSLDTTKKKFAAIKGELPSPLNPPSGCHFHPRCPHAQEICANKVPPIQHLSEGHLSACHLGDAIPHIDANQPK